MGYKFEFYYNLLQKYVSRECPPITPTGHRMSDRSSIPNRKMNFVCSTKTSGERKDSYPGDSTQRQAEEATPLNLACSQELVDFYTHTLCEYSQCRSRHKHNLIMFQFVNMHRSKYVYGKQQGTL